MSTVYDLFNKIDGKWVHIVEYGYEDIPEVMPFLYDMTQLNNKNLDFRSMSLKGIANEVSITETWEGIQWYEDDLKRPNLTVVTKNADDEFVVDSSSVQVGTQLYNQETFHTSVVIDVSWATITIDSDDASSSAGDVFTIQGHVKNYGDAMWHTTTRNALQDFTNYFQFVQEDITSDMISNNRTRLFIKDANEMAAQVFGDASRNMLRQYGLNFFFWQKLKSNNWTYTRYGAWGLESFIQWQHKVNIYNADKVVMRDNLNEQLNAIYSSWLANLFAEKKVLFYCNTAWLNSITKLYGEDAVVYNDKIEWINLGVKTVKLDGRVLYMVESSILNVAQPNTPTCYSVPMDYVFGYMLPNTVLDESAKKVDKLGKWQILMKPRNSIEKVEVSLFTSYSFMFKGISSGAYRRLIIKE